jgi:hypothetical protein
MPTHLQCLFYFSPYTQTYAKKNKKSVQTNAPDRADININLTWQTHGRKEERTANTGNSGGSVVT